VCKSIHTAPGGATQPDFSASSDVVATIDLDAWENETAGFSLELEGFYRRLLGELILHGGSCADDDNDMARLMRGEVRDYRRLKGKLIKKGLITVADGVITSNSEALS
jgi:hypothetical protein